MFSAVDTPNQLSNSRRPHLLPSTHLFSSFSPSFMSVNRKTVNLTRSPHKHVLTLENGAVDQTLAPRGGGCRGGRWGKVLRESEILNQRHTWMKLKMLLGN